MPIFEVNQTKLLKIKEKPFKIEREIQKLTEDNLGKIFGLQFVRSEFSLHNFRIDTLAYDAENQSFVIIEYKKDKNFSVIDQGYAYLSLMLNNKADFILEFNEHKEATLKRRSVDWSQSKVIFISPSFTSYQKQAINFKDLPIELWEIKRYENDTVEYAQVKTTGAKESINTISNKEETIKQVSKEIKVFTEDEHIKKSEFEIRELYERLKEGIYNLADEIELNPRKHFVGFKVQGNTFCDIVFLNKSLKIYINLKSGELDDPYFISRDVSNVGHWGNGAYELKMHDTENLEYILSLIKQSVKKHEE